MATLPIPTTISRLLSTQSSLIQTVCSFLTVSIHHILYLRAIYPHVSFLSTRAYNFPTRQNRHPAVCAWINSAVDAVRDQLEKNTVQKLSLCIFDVERNVVLEKWMFDLSAFPVVEKADADTPFAKREGEEVVSDNANDASGHRVVGGDQIYVANLEAQFRATLSRISSSSTRLTPLPTSSKECSFTLTIELRDNADRPVGRLDREDRKWIVAEPEPEPKPWSDADERPSRGGNDEAKRPSSSSSSSSSSRSPNQTGSGGKTISVRRLDAGELKMEVWVEESKAKFTYGAEE